MFVAWVTQSSQLGLWILMALKSQSTSWNLLLRECPQQFLPQDIAPNTCALRAVKNPPVLWRAKGDGSLIPNQARPSQTIHSPQWQGSWATESQWQHLTVPFWHSFPSRDRNNLCPVPPPPALLWVTMNMLGLAQRWPAFLLSDRDALCSFPPLWPPFACRTLFQRTKANRRQYSFSASLVASPQLCRQCGGAEGETMELLQSASFNSHWNLSSWC